MKNDKEIHPAQRPRSEDDGGQTFGTPGAPAAPKAGVPVAPNVPGDASLEAIANEPAGAPGGVQRAKSPPSGADPIDYRPDRKIHLAEAGKVALSNWAGRLNGRRVSVYRGAQASKIPADVQAAMAESGVEVGLITHAELGMRSGPAQFTLK